MNFHKVWKYPNILLKVYERYNGIECKILKLGVISNEWNKYLTISKNATEYFYRLKQHYWILSPLMVSFTFMTHCRTNFIAI